MSIDGELSWNLDDLLMNLANGELLMDWSLFSRVSYLLFASGMLGVELSRDILKIRVDFTISLTAAPSHLSLLTCVWQYY
jgi:hypothetical protein